MHVASVGIDLGANETMGENVKIEEEPQSTGMGTDAWWWSTSNNNVTQKR